MRDSASIRANSEEQEVLFEWSGFDGDDCFGDFHVDIAKETERERFVFGNCAIRVLRQLVRFFRGQQDKAGFGFRYPDIRTCDLVREGDGFVLKIHLEGANRSEEFRFSGPSFTFNDEFLKEYEGGTTEPNS